MFRMVQNTAGAVPKACGSPSKRGQMKLGDGGEGCGCHGDAVVPVHVFKPFLNRIPKGDAEGRSVS